MKKVYSIATIIMVFSLLLAACQPAGNEPTAVQGDLLKTYVAGTVTVIANEMKQSQVVLPTSTAAEVTSPTLEPTQAATQEPTSATTPTGVWLILQDNTNCRVGPGSSFGYVTQINAGEKVEAVARNPFDNYYLVRNPNNPGTYCWLWSQYSTVTGNITTLPVLTPQPTPTPRITPTFTVPPADVTFLYRGVETCGSDYYFKFSAENSGALIWRSFKLVVVDVTDDTTFIHTGDLFSDAEGCSIGLKQEDLTSGEYSYIVNYDPGQMTYNPVGIGHTFQATLTVYTNDGLTGTSVTKSLTITP
jgi:hypothetical protein